MRLILCVDIKSFLRYVVNGKSREQNNVYIVVYHLCKKKWLQLYLWKYVQETDKSSRFEERKWAPSTVIVRRLSVVCLFFGLLESFGKSCSDFTHCKVGERSRSLRLTVSALLGERDAALSSARRQSSRVVKRPNSQVLYHLYLLCSPSGNNSHLNNNDITLKGCCENYVK